MSGRVLREDVIQLGGSRPRRDMPAIPRGPTLRKDATPSLSKSLPRATSEASLRDVSLGGAGAESPGHRSLTDKSAFTSPIRSPPHGDASSHSRLNTLPARPDSSPVQRSTPMRSASSSALKETPVVHFLSTAEAKAAADPGSNESQQLVQEWLTWYRSVQVGIEGFASVSRPANCVDVLWSPVHNLFAV